MDDTLKALEMGAVETLICWENLDIQVGEKNTCIRTVPINVNDIIVESDIEESCHGRGKDFVPKQ